MISFISRGEYICFSVCWSDLIFGIRTWLMRKDRKRNSKLNNNDSRYLRKKMALQWLLHISLFFIIWGLYFLLNKITINPDLSFTYGQKAIILQIYLYDKCVFASLIRCWWNRERFCEWNQWIETEFRLRNWILTWEMDWYLIDSFKRYVSPSRVILCQWLRNDIHIYISLHSSF